MGDVIFLVAVSVFFGLAVAYVRGCAAVVGHETDEASVPAGVDGPPEGAP